MTHWEELFEAVSAFYKRLCDDAFTAGRMATKIGGRRPGGRAARVLECAE